MEALTEEYFFTKDAAQFLRLTQPALRNRVYRNAIPYRRVGGRLIFIKSELERWIREAPGLSCDDLYGK
jgi:hypothetical protein